ncbi:hypothetical protein ACO0LC_11440 [Undibacterium sp. JH2W]
MTSHANIAVAMLKACHPQYKANAMSRLAIASKGFAGKAFVSQA